MKPLELLGIVFNNLTSSPVKDSAREQPAFISGIKTLFSGLINFAVSAIKWTPHKIMISAEFLKLQQLKLEICSYVRYHGILVFDSYVLGLQRFLS